MKLWAISDLHVANPVNRAALRSIVPRPEDWLILAGDVCESAADLDLTLALLKTRFAQLLWVPGNHELWTVPREGPRGAAKYARMVEVCRSHGVLTPEDPYPVWEGDGGPHILAPLFLLYDYSFRPDGVTIHEAISMARETKTECADEYLLSPDPHDTREDWCRARVALSAARLEEARHRLRLPTVLVNHFPLRSEIATLPRLPWFSLWCGTRATADWHLRFGATAVVFGHLHIRQRRLIDGVRFEEVSLGYPRDWDQSAPIDAYLRQILPTPG